MTKQRGVYSFALYIFGFFLLWEWLRPLGEITDTGEIPLFRYFHCFFTFVKLFTAILVAELFYKNIVNLIFLTHCFWRKYEHFSLVPSLFKRYR